MTVALLSVLQATFRDSKAMNISYSMCFRVYSLQCNNENLTESKSINFIGVILYIIDFSKEVYYEFSQLNLYLVNKKDS